MKKSIILRKATVIALMLAILCFSVFAEAPGSEPAEPTAVPTVEPTEPSEDVIPDTDWTEPPRTVDPEPDPVEEPDEEDEPAEDDPTEQPVDEEPTQEPVGDAPTEEPGEGDPTEEPGEGDPTEEPGGDDPVDETPTEAPDDGPEPTEAPVEEAPTEEPETDPEPTGEPEEQTRIACFSYYVNDEVIFRDEYKLTVADEGYTCTVVLPDAPEFEGLEFAGWFMDDEEFFGGDVILPDGGEFIVTALYSEPEMEVPEYKVSVFTSVDGEEDVPFGTEITVYCVLEGFENTPYTLRWQYTPDDGESIFDMDDAVSESFSYILTEENAAYRYRVLVTVED